MLTGKQKRFLRALGHSLKPVITVGKSEVTEALTKETASALDAHELVKIKLLESCLMDRNEVARLLAEGCGAEVAQILGRTALLYRQAKEPKLELPKVEKKK
jgi:RNA-binding protein